MEFSRKKYVDKLIELQNNGRIKVITGIIGSGKTFLLKNLFIRKLISQGIQLDHANHWLCSKFLCTVPAVLALFLYPFCYTSFILLITRFPFSVTI